jgi:hypothetical protein
VRGMEIFFSAQEDFQDALKEVFLLTDLAADNQKDSFKYALFLKSSILFLATKFEAFLEDISREYVFKIEQCELSASHLPKQIILSSLATYLSDDFIAKLKRNNGNCLSELQKILPFLDHSKNVTTIDIGTKFNYGKHGQKEIERMFSRAGHENIFEKCKVYKKEESMLSEEEIEVEVDVVSDINALTGIRNSIIHENKAPGLTLKQVQGYMNNLNRFTDVLSCYLNVEILKLQKISAEISGQVNS